MTAPLCSHSIYDSRLPARSWHTAGVSPPQTKPGAEDGGRHLLQREKGSEPDNSSGEQQGPSSPPGSPGCTCKGRESATPPAQRSGAFPRAQAEARLPRAAAAGRRSAPQGSGPPASAPLAGAGAAGSERPSPPGRQGPLIRPAESPAGTVAAVLAAGPAGGNEGPVAG